MAHGHGFGGPPPGGPRGFGGPHGGPGGFGGPGGGPFGPRGYFGSSQRIYTAKPIVGAKGFANGTAGMSNSEFEFYNWVESVDCAVQKNEGKNFKKIRGFFKGTASFVTQPWHDNHHFMKMEMTQRAFDEHRITEEQYQNRMMKAQNNYLWFLCKSGMITDEQYEEQVNDLFAKYDKLERTI